MERKIRFSFEGERYSVGSEAYNLSRIVLPDGRLLVVGAWFDSLPPQADEISIEPHLFTGESVEFVAKTMKAAIAEKIQA